MARSASATGNWTRHLPSTCLIHRTARPLVGLLQMKSRWIRLNFERWEYHWAYRGIKLAEEKHLLFTFHQNNCLMKVYECITESYVQKWPVQTMYKCSDAIMKFKHFSFSHRWTSFPMVFLKNVAASNMRWVWWFLWSSSLDWKYWSPNLLSYTCDKNFMSDDVAHEWYR